MNQTPTNPNTDNNHDSPDKSELFITTGIQPSDQVKAEAAFIIDHAGGAEPLTGSLELPNEMERPSAIQIAGTKLNRLNDKVFGPDSNLNHGGVITTQGGPDNAGTYVRSAK